MNTKVFFHGAVFAHQNDQFLRYKFVLLDPECSLVKRALTVGAFVLQVRT